MSGRLGIHSISCKSSRSSVITNDSERLLNLERDVKFRLDGTQLSKHGKQMYDCGDTMTHCCTVNNVANHLNTTMSAVSRKQYTKLHMSFV